MWIANYTTVSPLVETLELSVSASNCYSWTFDAKHGRHVNLLAADEKKNHNLNVDRSHERASHSRCDDVNDYSCNIIALIGNERKFFKNVTDL